jgi:hypothetical protein
VTDPPTLFDPLNCDMAPAPVPPRYATGRNPDLPSLGYRVDRLSAALGRPLMPWQRRASGLLNELDRRGRRTHALTVVTIQRQAGKTSWLLAEAVERCLLGERPVRVWYTAQSGAYARDKWSELVTELSAPASPLRGRLRVRRTNGSESITFPNGSQLRPFPPTRDALHGHQSDLVIVDEAWRFGEIRGAELMQAIGPTQATRPGAQVVIVSTAGTVESAWLRAFVDRGRAGDPALAYLEWSIGDDVDPMDLDAVAAAHPAVGHTIDRSFLEREAAILADTPGEFARAYGNAWTAVAERVIPVQLWTDAVTTDAPTGAITLAADIAQDRTRAAIVACAGGVIEVVDSRDGIEWVAPRLVELVGRWQPAAVTVDRYGPAGTLYDQLVGAGVDLVDLTGVEYTTACARFLDDLQAGAIRHRHHPNLDAAVASAAIRTVGDRWVWARRTAAGPICELVAATLAVWLDQHRPAIPLRPDVQTG